MTKISTLTPTWPRTSCSMSSRSKQAHETENKFEVRLSMYDSRYFVNLGHRPTPSPTHLALTSDCKTSKVQFISHNGTIGSLAVAVVVVVNVT